MIPSNEVPHLRRRNEDLRNALTKVEDREVVFRDEIKKLQRELNDANTTIRNLVAAILHEKNKNLKIAKNN